MAAMGSRLRGNDGNICGDGDIWDDGLLINANVLGILLSLPMLLSKDGLLTKAKVLPMLLLKGRGFMGAWALWFR